MPKTAILLLNLGGPDSQDAIRPFLLNLFSDREIIQLPGGPLLQPLLARLIVAVRLGAVKTNYASIGGGSPILKWTRAQGAGIEAALGPDYRAFPCMRYWHPTAEEALRDALAWGAGRLVALTLYPHYSTATTGSSLRDLRRAMDRLGVRLPLAVVDRYPTDPAYLDAKAAKAIEALRGFPEDVRAGVPVLFSAHSLPMKFLEAGDPYETEIRATVAGVAERIAKAEGRRIEHRLGFQSQTGPVRWLGPGTEEVLRDLRREGHARVLVVPIAFVSDHIETLYEVDQLFADAAREMGFTDYRRCAMLNDDPAFARALAGLVRRASGETP